MQITHIIYNPLYTIGVQDYINKFFRSGKKEKGVVSSSSSSKPSQIPAGPSTIMNANLESDEDDGDFVLNEQSEEVGLRGRFIRS